MQIEPLYNGFLFVSPQRRNQRETDTQQTPYVEDWCLCWKSAGRTLGSAHTVFLNPDQQTWKRENIRQTCWHAQMRNFLGQKLQQKDFERVEIYLRWSKGQAWLNSDRDWRKASEESWSGPSTLKKCAAIGPSGLGAACAGGRGSIWRTDTTKLLSENFNTNSGLDSSPWVLDGWATTEE